MLHSWVVGYEVPDQVPPIIDSLERSLAGMVRHVHTELENAYNAVRQFQSWRQNADGSIKRMEREIDHLFGELEKTNSKLEKVSSKLERVEREAAEDRHERSIAIQETSLLREELTLVSNKLEEALAQNGAEPEEDPEEDPEEEPAVGGFDDPEAALDAALEEEFEP